MNTHKNCNGCKQMLPREDFYPAKARGPNRISGQCKACQARAAREWSKSPRGRARRKDMALERRLVSRGVTMEWYNEQFAKQGGVCAICRQVESRHRSGVPTRLNVDHCHQTGVVRGLLCTRCNSGIGLLGDSLPTAMAAVEYLREWWIKRTVEYPNPPTPGILVKERGLFGRR